MIVEEIFVLFVDTLCLRTLEGNTLEAVDAWILSQFFALNGLTFNCKILDGKR